MTKKVILHLCADTGSDSWPYQKDPDYEVILVGKDIGVENYHQPSPVAETQHQSLRQRHRPASSHANI